MNLFENFYVYENSNVTWDDVVAAQEDMYQACYESFVDCLKIDEALMMTDLAVNHEIMTAVKEAADAETEPEDKKAAADDAKADATEKASGKVKGALQSAGKKVSGAIEYVKNKGIALFNKFIAFFRKTFKLDALTSYRSEIEKADLTGIAIKTGLPNLEAGRAMLKRKETQAYEAVQRPVGAEKIDFKGAPAEVSKAFGASKERTVVDRAFVNKAIALIEKKDETIKGIEADKATFEKLCNAAIKTCQSMGENGASSAAALQAICAGMLKCYNVYMSNVKKAASVANTVLIAIAKGKAKKASDKLDKKEGKKKEKENNKTQTTKESTEILDEELDLYDDFEVEDDLTMEDDTEDVSDEEVTTESTNPDGFYTDLFNSYFKNNF